MTHLALLITVFSVLLTACSTTRTTLTLAEQSGFVTQTHPTSTFVITSFEHLPDTPPSKIHVYIEGDGNSWKTKYMLSDNPTPKRPLALSLALLDPHPHVIYLARPCQYTPHSQDKLCHPKFWSSHRYAKEVIQAENEVLDQIKAKFKNKQFVLVGFSGGASVAALLASERQDIATLITVAGDLNHVELNKYHHTSPLKGSLNPTDVAYKLKNLPQHHWSGEKDPIVPPFIATNFFKSINNPTTTHIHLLKNADHHKEWEKNWRSILQQSLDS